MIPYSHLSREGLQHASRRRELNIAITGLHQFTFGREGKDTYALERDQWRSINCDWCRWQIDFCK